MPAANEVVFFIFLILVSIWLLIIICKLLHRAFCTRYILLNPAPFQLRVAPEVYIAIIATDPI
ncbi:hypothetical protein DRW42_03000 [Pedobacter miscanthi]|uniref:Uncharacterized protein n=1 Tax=Pedobacter miscanthi TaxID=2259170 RepID=A0A366LC32_9SPHI|nr:hypothetical protein DRW42_03000 [Pedobacter miscanthi]